MRSGVRTHQAEAGLGTWNFELGTSSASGGQPAGLALFVSITFCRSLVLVHVSKSTVLELPRSIVHSSLRESELPLESRRGLEFSWASKVG